MVEGSKTAPEHLADGLNYMSRVHPSGSNFVQERSEEKVVVWVYKCELDVLASMDDVVKCLACVDTTKTRTDNHYACGLGFHMLIVSSLGSSGKKYESHKLRIALSTVLHPLLWVFRNTMHRLYTSFALPCFLAVRILELRLWFAARKRELAHPSPWVHYHP